MDQAPKISSPKNPLVRRFRAVAGGDEPRLMFAEGIRLVAEALDAGLRIPHAVWSPKLTAHAGGEELVARLQARAGAIQQCSDQVLARVSSLKTHQGVAALLERPVSEFSDLLGPVRSTGSSTAMVVVAAGIQDPGNLGALVRCAEAAGATGFVALLGCADPYREKALRGSAGSIFRLPCLQGMSSTELLAMLVEHDLQILVTESGGGQIYWQVDYKTPLAMVLGAEGSGVPEEFRTAARHRISIPLAPAVESLNVAVAAGVILFEARRQRS